MGCIFICNLPGTVLLNYFKFLLISFFLVVFSRRQLYLISTSGLPWAENLSVRPSFFILLKFFLYVLYVKKKFYFKNIQELIYSFLLASRESHIVLKLLISSGFLKFRHVQIQDNNF